MYIYMCICTRIDMIKMFGEGDRTLILGNVASHYSFIMISI